MQYCTFYLIQHTSIPEDSSSCKPSKIHKPTTARSRIISLEIAVENLYNSAKYKEMAESPSEHKHSKSSPATTSPLDSSVWQEKQELEKAVSSIVCSISKDKEYLCHYSVQSRFINHQLHRRHLDVVRSLQKLKVSQFDLLHRHRRHRQFGQRSWQRH